jgi:B-cell receptor-associated protein 31
MSFQWSLIASFLYLEIFVVGLLLLPFISSQRWQKLFKSRFLRGLGQQVYIYFYVILAFLILCLIDAVREMRKYDGTDGGKAKDQHQHLEQELRNSMVLFRAQRNFYITGFSLFLVFVIRRLMTLLAQEATLAASAEAALKQASSASDTARSLMKQQTEKSSNESDEVIAQLKQELAASKKEHEKTLRDIETMKSQSDGVSREYDRLLEEHEKVTKRLSKLEGQDAGDKKDD